MEIAITIYADGKELTLNENVVILKLYASIYGRSLTILSRIYF